MDDSFDLAIKEHLELQRRNRMLDGDMPLDHYRDPRAAAATAAVLEETQEWVLPGARTVIDHEPLFPPAEDLWTGTPAFDWGN